MMVADLCPLDHHSHAIVDRAAMDGHALPDDIRPLPLVPAELETDADKMPGLIVLSSLSATSKAALVDNLEAALAGQTQSLLSCLLDVPPQVTTQALRRHLVSRLVLPCPQGRVFLRFYDPRVFRHLQWILDGEQQRALFGPVTRWTLCISGLESRPRPKATTHFTRWHVSAAQRAQLDRVGLLNHVLAQRQLASPDAAPAFETAPAQVIDSAIDVAQTRYGFRHEGDLVAFALHALDAGSTFHEHTIIQSLIAELDNNECSYADASAALSAASWQRIRNAPDDTRRHPVAGHAHPITKDLDS